MAPTSPPTSAWDELEGRPNHHVTRFQITPPRRAAMMVSVVTNFASTSPEVMVFATAVPTMAPPRLVMVARRMA